MVNKERVELAVDALESGEFAQGIGRLRRNDATVVKSSPAPDTKLRFDGDEFCCLGVLCEVAIANGLEMTRELVAGCYKYKSAGSEGSGVVLPWSAAEWYGFDSVDPEVHPLDSGHGQVTALQANDEHLWDFGKIAEAFRRLYLQSEEPRDE